ncbi:MAG: hypothetical protein IJ700_08895 [Bacteroidaceae bacterium]|nr:hypothetical protein [Bacteroidaceae bacterium]MBR1683448.1 hypothetical protein [Bacteroidaceae bacterium]
MKQRLLSFFALAALTMSAMAQSWTAPVEPTKPAPLELEFTASEVEAGNVYFIRNVGCGQFIVGGNSWGTQISVSDTGLPLLPIRVDASGDYYELVPVAGTYLFHGTNNGRENYNCTLNGSSQKLFRDNEASGFVDLGTQNRGYTWQLNPTGEGYGYYIQNADFGTYPNSNDQYASVAGPGAPVVFNSDIEAENIVWEFINQESVDMEDLTAKQEAYNAEYSAYETALAIYNARVPFYEMLNDAVTYGADYAEASAVYNNDEATADEIKAATEALRPLVAKALVAYINANPDVENPINLTKYLLTNADLSAGNLTGWTIEKPEGATGNYQYQGATYKSADESVTIQGFIESWVAAPNTLNDGKMYQKVGGLPNGRYILECDAMAINQTDNAAEAYIEKEDYTGVYLYYSDGKISLHGDALASDRTDTEDEETGKWSHVWHPAHFAYTFDLSTESDTITVGLMIDNTNLNWIGGDNFQLTYVGKVQSLPSYTALVAEVAAAESYLETEPYAQKAAITALEEALAAAKPLATAVSDDSKDAEYQAAFAQLNGARQAVVESVAAYVKLNTFIETLEADIEKYDEKAGYDALVAKLTNLQTELTTGYDNQTISTEEINAKIDGYADMIAADIQKLFDDAVAAGEPIEEGLDISPLFKDMTFAYGTTQTAFANGYPAENPVWMNETKTGNFKTNYSTAEVWDARPFNIYRDLENLPKGKYTVKTHAFYRAAANDTNYPGYQNGDYDATEYAYIYAGANHTHLVNNAALGTPTAKTGDWDAGDGNYIPNSQQGAHELFTDPAYAEQAALAYIEVSGNVLADGGTLRVGFAGTNELQANHWCIFDGFEIYYNGIPETLDGEIEALIAELEAYAPFVVETATLYSEALAAASAALGADRETQVAVIAQLEEAIAACKLSEELYNKLFDTVLPEYEKKRDDSYGTGTFTDETLATILQEIQDAQKDDQIQSNEQMQGWIDALPVAWVNYILSMEELDDATEANPIVVPIIVNGDFETGNKNGWTVEQQGNAGGDGNGAAEFWGATSFDIYQEFPKLKDGYWRLSVDALYRYGGSASDCNARAAGTITNPEYFYINDLAVNVVSWSDLERGAFRYTGEKDDDGNDITPYELAIDNNALIKYDVTPAEGEPYSFWSVNTKTGFELVINLKDEDEKPVNRFHNEIVFGYGEGLDVTGAVRLGLKKAEKPSSDNDWCPFDNFKLEYLGTEAPVAVTSLEAEPAKAMTGALYSIDGRIVRNVTSAADLRGLSRGIYIIGGKKVTIK